MADVRRFIRMLKAECPTICVKVRICRVPKSIFGDCRRMADHFLIRISKDASKQTQIDTLVHEFAHAESFLEWESTGQHGPVWGVAHARFYRVYERFISES
jgi:hypothetical protein